MPICHENTLFGYTILRKVESFGNISDMIRHHLLAVRNRDAAEQGKEETL